MRIAIIGSRGFSSYKLLSEVLEKYESNISLVVSGGARGADTVGENWAKRRDIPVKIFKPDWDRYGKSAGYVRNKEIISNCDGCIVFWDGESTGAQHSFKLCKELSKPLKVINVITGKEVNV